MHLLGNILLAKQLSQLDVPSAADGAAFDPYNCLQPNQSEHPVHLHDRADETRQPLFDNPQVRGHPLFEKTGKVQLITPKQTEVPLSERHPDKTRQCV